MSRPRVCSRASTLPEVLWCWASEIRSTTSPLRCDAPGADGMHLRSPTHAIWRSLSEAPLRLPRWGLRPAGPDDPPLFRFDPAERTRIVELVTRRVLETVGPSRTDTEWVLNDAARHEIRRLLEQKDEERRERLAFWRSIVRRIDRMDEEALRRTLHRVTRHMAEDVAGYFDPRVYELARHVAPRLIAAVMEPSALPRGLTDARRALDELLDVEGEVETLKSLHREGTLVFVPTHSSNLDSIVLGQALERCGLPPVVYGAGKNLFTNPLLSFFMHNLGAYRVDRRIQARLYKDVLKTYAGVMVERGYHSLFFPGGTRSRSGAIERSLKLGLLGASVEAYARRAVAGRERPIWFVPTTINYALVLEAESLAEDWFERAGKSRFILPHDEFGKLERWVSFFRRLVGMRSACVIRFGPPLDPFGNLVDAHGHSHAPDGHVVSPIGYVTFQGVPHLSAARDRAYTRALGSRITEAYRRHSVLMSTNLVAHVLFRKLVAETPGLDLFARIRLRGELSMDREQVRVELGTLRDRLRALEQQGAVRLGAFPRRAEPGALLDRALRIWAGYHRRMAVHDLGGSIRIEDPMLLAYYQNRLLPWVRRVAPPEYTEAARQIAAMEAMT